MKIKKLEEAFWINPLYESDSYKVGHHAMLAPNTVREYWTWIPRNLKNMHPSIKKIMAAGGQLVTRYLHSVFQQYFFNQPIDVAMKFIDDMSKHLMIEYNGDHFIKLHKLGYLPIVIQGLKEGTFTNPGLPHLAGMNTKDGYAWLGLYLETLISKLAWQMPTSATITAKFRENSIEWVTKTDSENLWFVDFMNHDFHSRGGNPFTSIAVGLGHALSSKGSDTLNVIPASRYYYDFDENDVPTFSVNASEHSVTCTQIFYYEDLLRRGLLNDRIEQYYAFDIPSEGSVEAPDWLAIAEWLNLEDWIKRFPKGILSYVCDTFDTWKLITYILPRLKKEIMARKGKLVVRPDTGDPVDIICGFNYIELDSKLHKSPFKTYIPYDDKFEHGDYYTGKQSSHNKKSIKVFKFLDKYYEYKGEETVDQCKEIKNFNIASVKGVIELLYDIFGGDRSKEGYIRLDSHIGAIYGDSINLERQIQMYERLAAKGFASTNIVLGVGSYTYVMLTRDSAGYAAKGAWFERLERCKDCTECNDTEWKSDCRKSYNIYKDPATGDGTKKSLKGFQFVYLDKNGEIKVESEVSEEKAFSDENLLQVIYKDGEFFNQTNLVEIREKINKN